MAESISVRATKPADVANDNSKVPQEVARGPQATQAQGGEPAVRNVGHSDTDALVTASAAAAAERLGAGPRVVPQSSAKPAPKPAAQAAAAEPERIYLRDYAPPAFLVPKVDLRFEIDGDATTVTATSRFERQGEANAPIELDGNPNLELVAVRIDGRELSPSEYTLRADRLVIPNAPDACDLTVVTRIAPAKNTSAMGLYQAGEQLISQCEPDGFRRMTFAADRPDVMSVYTTTVVADRERFPRLLSNGNEQARGELPDGRHFVTFHDPFPKPSYLFALVAGRFDELVDSFVTKSGREVRLEIYSDPGDREKTRWAMECLKASMKWDEQVNGLECDLDRYAIVVTSVFNFGAMENKGLNVFNASAALADPRTATDTEFGRIDTVIGHEYFHNWTGNRVTMREPLQLTLKEGLTVFRDQEYTATRRGRALTRLSSVSTVTTGQFAEDAGPQAHAIRPESYISPDNLYTSTVYRKGAEVVRMLHTLVGEEGFQRGMAEYFRRHDGQAVTTEDFVAAIASVNKLDASQFLRWYAQVGTPTVAAQGSYDAQTKTFTLTLEQRPGREGEAPLHIPVRVALLGSQGDLPLRVRGGAQSAASEVVLELKQARQTFVFEGVDERPVPSVLRDFSAPVKLELEQPVADLEAQLARDTDPYNRFAASQKLATNLLLDMVAARQRGEDPKAVVGDRLGRYVDALRQVLQDPALDGAFKAQLLSLPPSITLAQRLEVWDFEAIVSAREELFRSVGKGLAPELQRVFDEAVRDTKPYVYNREQVARRALKNTALAYLAAAGAPKALEQAAKQFSSADNMTERFAALATLADEAIDSPQTRKALRRFYAEFENEPLVLNKWFSLQAYVDRPGTLERVKELLAHPKFDKRVPNMVSALLGSFTGNYRQFHAADGSGYRFIADQVIELQTINASKAASLASTLGNWRRLDEGRAAAMKGELERILAVPNLAREVFEVVSNALGKRGAS